MPRPEGRELGNTKPHGVAPFKFPRISEKTGVMTKLQCRLDPELWHWDPWLITIEHQGDLPRPSGYYAAESKDR